MNQKPGEMCESSSNSAVSHAVSHPETNGNTSQVHILSAGDIELPVVSQASDLLCLDT